MVLTEYSRMLAIFSFSWMPMADEGEDTQIGIQEFLVLELDLIFFGEKIVEPLDKIGEQF